MTASKEHLENHYADLKGKGFFPGLIKYMGSGPVVAMVWQGQGAVKTGRQMLGATNPADSLPGTIRGDYCIQVGGNICHGSDSVDSAEKEIKLWFKTGRQMLGATNPADSLPGTIRGDYCIQVGRNICHGSDSVDSAE